MKGFGRRHTTPQLSVAPACSTRHNALHSEMWTPLAERAWVPASYTCRLSVHPIAPGCHGLLVPHDSRAPELVGSTTSRAMPKASVSLASKGLMAASTPTRVPWDRAGGNTKKGPVIYSVCTACAHR